MPSAPKRLLFLHPDAYGDLVLFEPVPRLVREFWPETEVAVLIRKPYEDIVPVLGGDIRWLTTECNPYREGPGTHPAAVEALRETVQAFAPDCVVAACAEQTWLEAVVASFLPEARQVSLGNGLVDPVARAALDAVRPVDWPAIYPEKILVELSSLEWEKNLRLASALLGREVPRWWPAAQVPGDARERAGEILAGAGLSAGKFAVCAAAGTANVAIKSWPAEHYGDTLAWLERERGVRALLIGHVSEREHLEGVRQRAREGGADPALWTGQSGEMPVLAGLLEAAGFYFGNDTGALHLAAALARPVAAVFGGGNWLRFRPVARRSAVVVQPLPCFGCGWHCYFGYAPCSREIPADAGRRALEWLLASDEEASTEITVEDAISPEALELIHETTAVRRSQGADRNAAGGNLSQKALADLFKQLEFSEADRAERLAAIEKQGVEISRLHAEVDQHLRAASEFWPKLDAATNERNLLTAQLEDLRGHFEREQADNAARLDVIERQGAEIARLHAEMDRQLQAANDFWPRLDAATNERNLLTAQLEDLRSHFEREQADNAARLEIIERQGAEIVRLHAEVDQHIQTASEFWPKLDAAINERNLLAAQMEDLRGHFERAVTDNAARLDVIQKQGTESGELRAQLSVTQSELADLRGHYKASEADSAKRLKIIETQGIELGELRSELAITGSALAELKTHYQRSEADRAARLKLIETQGAELGKLRAQLSLTQSELSDLRGHYKASEADRAARLEVIETQGAANGQLQAQLAEAEAERGQLSAEAAKTRAQHTVLVSEHKRLTDGLDEIQASHAALTSELEAVQKRQRTLETHWTARLLKTIRLWPL